ncbi:hypothetical protein C8R45DRAFT_638397 [Mycena sanguinolenta]|nr:hypothetical protein C8R45DRAFT_638397 [Mycena sanguinolenta]
MGDDIHAEAQLAEESTVVSFFSNSKEISVAGGVFTSQVTNNFHRGPSNPSDFRMIPLGDIDLQREIRLDVRLNVVDRPRERTCVQRIYTAKIEGRTSDMTVAMYQGNTAEEEWRGGVSTLAALRHPNVLQLYGMASSSSVYAAVYHGGVSDTFRAFLRPLSSLAFFNAGCLGLFC